MGTYGAFNKFNKGTANPVKKQLTAYIYVLIRNLFFIATKAVDFLGCSLKYKKSRSFSNADKIIVLDEGKIVGQGKHEELLKSNKVYREIALSQLSDEELKSVETHPSKSVLKEAK